MLSKPTTAKPSPKKSPMKKRTMKLAAMWNPKGTMKKSLMPATRKVHQQLMTIKVTTTLAVRTRRFTAPRLKATPMMVTRMLTGMMTLRERMRTRERLAKQMRMTTTHLFLLEMKRTKVGNEHDTESRPS